MTRYLLITRPEYDYTTRYISAWAEKCFDIAKQKGYSIIDLRKWRANRKEFESVIKKRTPQFVVLNGHGNDSQVVGHGNEVLIDYSTNSVLLNGKVTYAVSCKSAKKLGAEIGKNLDTAYIGYREDFAFLYLGKFRTRPTEDILAGFFLRPSNTIIGALLKGHSAGNSFLRGKQEFLRNIQKLLTSKTSSDDYSALRYLVWDMKYLTLCGDKNKKLS